MRPLILIGVYHAEPPWRLEDALVEQIRKAAGERFEVYAAASHEDLRRRMPEAEILFAFRLAPEDFPAARAMKWVQSTSAGVDKALYDDFVSSDILLTTASGIHAVPISETAIGMMLALARKLPHYLRCQARKHWDRAVPSERMEELSGKTLCIVGLGAIGEALAARAKAFGMRVVGVKNHPAGYRGAADDVRGPDRLEEAMREADFVAAILPVTPATRGLISARMIAAMKPSAYFLNFGRGPTVDENALANALKNGIIAGAGLDVFEHEPLPPASPLWKLENVIVTPHISGHTPRYYERATELFVENIRRYIAGDQLLNLVNKEAGY